MFDQQISIAGRALGHPARVYVLRLLQENGPKQFTDLVKALPLNEGTVTAHLKKLRKEGLVEVEEKGLVNIYSLNPEGVKAMFDLQRKLYFTLCGSKAEDVEMNELKRQLKNDVSQVDVVVR